MNKTTMVFAMVIALAAVFAIASPIDSAMAQTSESAPHGEQEGNGDYKDESTKMENPVHLRKEKLKNNHLDLIV